MDHPSMETIAKGISSAGVRVIRFAFPYMARRTAGTTRGWPDCQSVLLESWRLVIDKLGGGETLVVGGRSLGGRMASLIADDVSARGLICLGYPFHPVGKPEKLRTKHLAHLQTPTLIVQGERDLLGSKTEAASYDLSDAIHLHWLADGNHSFAPRKSSGRTAEQNLAEAVEVTTAFIRQLSNVSSS